MENDKLRRCRRCGELKGRALVDDPWQGPTYVNVICVCKGIACRSCGKRMVRRPISDHFEEATGTVWHTPWFGALMPCSSCPRGPERPGRAAMSRRRSAFLAALAEAERAIAARPPLTPEQREAGWEEDPGGSGLRRNTATGEWDDSVFVGAPGWYVKYREGAKRRL